MGFKYLRSQVFHQKKWYFLLQAHYTNVYMNINLNCMTQALAVALRALMKDQCIGSSGAGEKKDGVRSL